MYTRANFSLGLLLVAGVIVVAQSLAQAQKRFDTEITQIGDAAQSASLAESTSVEKVENCRGLMRR